MKSFISYSSMDRRFVRKLATDLKRRGAQVWLDEWEIKVGDEIRQRIEHGISEYDYFVVILSKHSVESTWVEKELNAAFMKEITKKRIVILPVLAEKCDIPPLISGKKYADFTKSYAQGFRDLAQVLLPVPLEIPRKTESKVLIVQDDLTFAESIATSIRSYTGWTVSITYDLYAAVELAMRYQPDCALIDVWYARSGFGERTDQCFLLERLRSAAPRMKLFGLSGFPGLPREIEKLFDRVFYKPTRLDDIVAALGAALPREAGDSHKPPETEQ
jgi:ActR/RegA family two-component response regulator